MSHVEAQESVRRIIQNEILEPAACRRRRWASPSPSASTAGMLFFDGGFADLAERRPITPELAVQHRLTAQAVRGDASRPGRAPRQDGARRSRLELPAGAWRDGGDIRRVTVGQLATHTSGLLLPQDHPPWPTTRYTLASFLESAQGLESRCCAPARPPTSLHSRRLHPAAAHAGARPRRFHRRPGRAKDLRTPRHELQLDTQTRARTAGAICRHLCCSAPCRAIPRTASPSASQAISRPTTTGQAQGRCTVQCAILPSSWTPTWAKVASHRRSPEP